MSTLSIPFGTKAQQKIPAEPENSVVFLASDSGSLRAASRPSQECTELQEQAHFFRIPKNIRNAVNLIFGADASPD